jgi:ribosomal protein S6--L-glutamate ligase
MILSFHPMFVADRNLICAGRDPGPDEQRQILASRAVILPQGCRQTLYEMAARNCPHVFPNYAARFEYAGKIGQIELFRKTGVKHPATETFCDLAQFRKRHPKVPHHWFAEHPLVFKFDWGGEGETVSVLHDRRGLEDVLGKAEILEAAGQKGFLIQRFIQHGGRVLRVVVMDRQVRTYWRVQDDASKPLVNLRHGGRIDARSEPEFQKQGGLAAAEFCRSARINLAGLDMIFSTDSGDTDPYVLEINYFFGRRGLGGSECYYGMLSQAINQWLRRKGLSLNEH